MIGILTFHDVGAGEPPLCFSPDRFERLLAGLADAGFSFVDLDALLGEHPAGSALALTFDDGYAGVLEHALPVLRSLEVPAHLFVPTAHVGARSFEGRPARMLSWRELKLLSDSGVRIESHAHRHQDLRTLADEAIDRECSEADAGIEACTGRPPRYFAYPLGHHDDRVRRVVARRYRAALTTELRPLTGTEDPARVPRIDAFYLRSRAGARLFCTGAAPVWLAARRVLRRLRGSE